MTTIEAFRAEYLRYKELGEKAIAQLSDAQLSQAPGQASNSIATICWHLSGNLRSRFTDFLTSDGEKPWRKRDEEFDARVVSTSELLDKWGSGWSVVLATLEGLTDADLQKQITIRGESMPVIAALMRSLAHTASHVGQILYAAKLLRGDEWTYLSIPPGGSDAFNRKMARS